LFSQISLFRFEVFDDHMLPPQKQHEEHEEEPSNKHSDDAGGGDGAHHYAHDAGGWNQTAPGEHHGEAGDHHDHDEGDAVDKDDKILEGYFVSMIR